MGFNNACCEEFFFRRTKNHHQGRTEKNFAGFTCSFQEGSTREHTSPVRLGIGFLWQVSQSIN